MSNKTILSVAISCILWGGMSSGVFAAVDITDVPDETTTVTEPTTTEPAPTGTTQPPPPTGTQPAPTGTTQPPPPTGTQPAPTGTTQPPPPTGTQPAPTGTTQPPPPTGTQPAPTGTTQPPPPTGTQPAPTGTTQPPPPTGTQPAPTGTTQPPPPTGTEPAPTGTTQPPPPTGTQPAPTGTTQPPPPTGTEPAPTGTTQPPPPTGTQPAPTGTTQPPPPTGTEPAPTGTKPPPTGTEPAPTGTKPPPTGTEPAPTGTKPPPTGTEPAPTGTKPPPTGTQPAPTGTKPPPTGTQPGQPTETRPKPNKPNFTDLGMEDEDVTRFDAEKLQKLPPQAFGAFDKNNIKQLAPEAMAQVTPEQMGQLSTDAIDGLKPEHVNKMPPNAMLGLTAKQLGSSPPVVLQKLPAEHFKNIDTKTMQSLEGKDLSKLLVNLDASQIKPQDVKDRLPPGWQINNKGRLTPPAGTALSLPTKATVISNNTVKIAAPTEVPDLDKTFALGGQDDGNGTVLDGMNTCLKTAGYPNFKIKQQATGTLVVEGSGDAQGTELAFTPESDSMKQVSDDVPTGLTQDETGHFVLTTPDKQQVTVIPTPKDTEQVAESLGEAGSLKIDKHGVVMLETRQDLQSPKQVRPVVFDPMITKAPQGKKAGIYVEGSVGEVVYADGTAQKMLPTVPLPDKFIVKALVIPGVEKIQHNADGTFTVKYKGMVLKLLPMQFEAQTTPVAEGQTVEPNIAVQADGTVKYTTQDEPGTEQLEVTLAITE